MTQATTRNAARAVGVALAVTACNPPGLNDRPVLLVLLSAAVSAGAWYAAPAVVRRPVRTSAGPLGQLHRHRNTALAAGSVLLAAWTRPGPPLAAGFTALLLAYLLLTDALAGGPPGRAQLRGGLLPAVAYGVSALVLTVAFLPLVVDGWAALIAVAAVVGAAAVVARSLRGAGSGNGPGPRP